MHIGLGLPIADPAVLLDWARRADAGPFSTLGLLDRVVYDNPEPLIALSVIAGATSRIKVQTEVLLAPTRDTALLAKQVATLDRMSGGRFVLGLGVGGRADDHLATGTDLRTRGRRLDQQLEQLRRVWSGEPFGADCGPIGPAPTRPGGPELLFGGFKPVALERVARWGDGYLSAVPPHWAEGLFDTVRTSWREHGRDGEPRIVAQVNVALGPQQVVDQARAAIGDYYEFTGWADNMVSGMRTTPDEIRAVIKQFADLGADEVMLYCYGTDPEQVDRIAYVIG
ncbi:LLM class flavin-dependent oxidoreductase [Nocardia cyriacigeorgica]|uniref:LLM class flavin-dependent oxidoreductase n=1 Tax=Nocardia cyriacigeorgica TaxID=135487 RepID=A0A5R8P010_9NOCA|nr:LLM class flavin-dependent oxidoreductase [Nocardia cyriacigeorgica]TLF82510.1 LLM class flavin-dependent oxidoreductase [Nocardia cyriacigeorgica]